MKIYKYAIPITDSQQVVMPEFSEILCVQMQHDVPVIWAKVDEYSPSKTVTIAIVGTGNEMAGDVETNGKYIGTIQTHGGSLVWHVFAIGL